MRPAVIVSNDGANGSVALNRRGLITVVPLASDTARVLAFQVFLGAGESRLPKDAKARCELIRAVPRERVLQRVGSVPEPRMAEIDIALRRHLAL